VVHEQILTALGGDEAIPLPVVKPFYSASCHYNQLLLYLPSCLTQAGNRPAVLCTGKSYRPARLQQKTASLSNVLAANVLVLSQGLP
jgi:hypothetical protein